MRFKQTLEEGEDRPLSELGVPVRTLNMFEKLGGHYRDWQPRVPMLSHVVGKDVWDKDNYEDRPRSLGNVGLKNLMVRLNKAGYALGSPSLDKRLNILPIDPATVHVFCRGGMTYLDHATTKSRQQIELILAGYGFTEHEIKECVDEVERLLHGVGLYFAENEKP